MTRRPKLIEEIADGELRNAELRMAELVDWRYSFRISLAWNARRIPQIPQSAFRHSQFPYGETLG
jgi:hypothetical protein